MPDDNEVTLLRVTLTLCTLCLSGKGGECHSPGCALWMRRAPDVPVTQYQAADDYEEAIADDVRFAVGVLEAAAPPREQDEGHYANRALTYLHRIQQRLAQA